MRALVTGSRGFLGRNLIHVLKEKGWDILEFENDNTLSELKMMCHDIDFLFHFGAKVRPDNPDEYSENVEFTKKVLEILEVNECFCPVVFSSSIQVELNNPYGKSKREEESIINDYGKKHTVSTYIFRFPNLFGKWARPNYTSVVATFCYNTSHEMPIVIHDASATIKLAFVENTIETILSTIVSLRERRQEIIRIDDYYSVSIGELAYYMGVLKRKDTPRINRTDSFYEYLYRTYCWYEEQNE